MVKQGGFGLSLDILMVFKGEKDCTDMMTVFPLISNSIGSDSSGP